MGNSSISQSDGGPVGKAMAACRSGQRLVSYTEAVEQSSLHKGHPRARGKEKAQSKQEAQHGQWTVCEYEARGQWT
eukprot:CAMPEP_0174741008 /NCGR_PEP_ID=MMETSP1094-20130205/75061_1 /TAXON_ID=156173 /ORGANISM="Chrysochromulina brevifilum, Strain UTEX LB 985" /LENGTH=75 /DNA_ID=CAMNT_0015944823 /DNA_START=35 /DNA_END=258 /DNA_ORIENTATION=-